jgi:catechol 2,3-dioxygenase-like lactoylglutathione lyase family enzyme
VCATCTCCGETVEGSVHLHSRRDIVICYGCLDWLNGRRDRQVAAHSGGWRVVGSDPIFTVADVARSVDHYQRLGFEISHHDATYAFAHRDRDLTIHLAQGQAGAQPRLVSLYIHVDDAERMAEEWRRAGLQVVGPEDFDYGKREGSHTDPDGNLIRFGSPLPPPPAD